ncbi:hypothetical protein [Rhodobacter sp. CZR27]|uniref:hypothetical protein n=1 Tax=Rhodobacter sp. CZR27 TaxID=2033869 RepID=UPI000BBE4398|nr:hypothetical protein [Rhodobacter sp. CZR27]
MSRAAPFLIDDLLPPGVSLLGIRPVNCRRIPRAARVVAMALDDASAPDLHADLAELSDGGEEVALLIAAEGRGHADAAAAALERHGLPGLVLRIEARTGLDWIGRLQALARRLAPAAALTAAEPAASVSARRYLAKMRELEDLIDPLAAPAERESERLPDRALNWRARLHARAVTRFLRRQGASKRPGRPVAATVLPDRARLGIKPSARSLGCEELAREEALLDRLIAEERLRRAALVRAVPIHGGGRLPRSGLCA